MRSRTGFVVVAAVLMLGGVLWLFSGSEKAAVQSRDLSLPASGAQAGKASPQPVQSQVSAQTQATQPVAAASAPPATAPSVPRFRDEQYVVQTGDTLEGIFAKHQFAIGDLYEILQADEPYLVLDVLKPGDQLTFRTDAQNRLQAMSVVIDPSKTVTYRLAEAGGFEYHEKVIPTTWVTEVMQGDVNGSFYVSARKAGLSDKTAMTIYQLLKNRLDFRRDLRAGDLFGVVVQRETIKGQPIGNDRLLAVRIRSRRVDYGAYLNSSNGSYYDAKGDNLTPALLRYPTRKRFRVSSSFNPRRLNPVTKRYAPHNGVDFATPIGTPVIATGDGRVTRAANHRYAGKYLEIDEFGPYASRYMHLSKIMVRKGQRVKRGQVIALSGNTGRSTGPHLHYELHIKGKAVNPITAKIPMLKSISKQQRVAFREQVKVMQEMLGDIIQLTAHGAPKPAGKATRRGT